MRIEEAIQQTKPFRNAWHRATVNILYTNNWVQEKIKGELKPYGITMQQYNVLRVLRGAGKPISTSVIRDRLLDKMADTSRMVERLYQKGLVLRNSCRHDKRLVDVSISSEGEKLLDSLKRINPGMDEILRNLTEEEAEVLSELLDKARGGQ
ncbi:MAG: MarR family transcriptional regulator [Phaeodactylibacter sp.]|nr:MarR family transcriptional regulator [Phaeodactylibacter sp.]MCB9264633.1 MarR family transcriptional regulator [Lewinellaceae bacterium]MCB9287264.1 MarR family transcriptional regulator [Lewinellaceae bacterium]